MIKVTGLSNQLACSVSVTACTYEAHLVGQTFSPGGKR